MATVPRSQPVSLSQRAHQWGEDTKAPMNDLPVEIIEVTNPGGMLGEDSFGNVVTNDASDADKRGV